jgi:WD40 repeat protein
MRWLLLYSCLIILNTVNGQRIYPPDEVIITTGASNHFSLYQPAKNRLVVFEKNRYWFTDIKGVFLEGPFVIGSKTIEPESPRLSPSGNIVSLYYPAPDILEDRFLMVFDLDSTRLLDADKMLMSYDLDNLSFINESSLKWYGLNKYDRNDLNKYWNFLGHRQKYFSTDSAKNGFLDYTQYSRFILYAYRNKDSVKVAALDSASDKNNDPLPLKLYDRNKTISARYTEGYPFVYIMQPGIINVYRFNDPGFQLVNSIKGDYDVISAAATEQVCYLLLKDTVNGKADHYLYNVNANTTQLVTGSFHKKTVFKLYPAKGFLTASHPFNGNISAYSLNTAETLWNSFPAHWKNNTANMPAIAEKNVVQNTVSVLIKQGKNNALRNFYNEHQNEVIQVKENKIAFVDATSGCLKRWVPFEVTEPNSAFEISPSKKYLLTKSMKYKDELLLYPDKIKVSSIDSGKTLFNIQSSTGTLEASFLNNDLLLAEGFVQDHVAFNVFDLKTGTSKQYVVPEGYDALTDITNGNDGLYFIYKSDTSVIVQHESGKVILRLKPAPPAVPKAFFSKGVPYLFIGPKPGDLSVYRLTANTASFIRKFPKHAEIKESVGSATSCLVTYIKEYDYSGDQKEYLYDVVTGKEKVNDTSVPELGDITPTISSIAYSPDGRYLATANPSGKVMLWDLGTGKETKVLKVDRGGYITRLCFTPNGDHLAASSGDIWETASGKNILSVTNRKIYDVNSIDISKDGNYIVSGGAYILLWDVESGEIIKSFMGPDSADFKNELGGGIKDDYAYMVFATAFHPGSKTFATGNRKGSVYIIDKDTGFVKTRRFFSTGQQSQRIVELKYTANGNYLLAMQENILYKLNSTTLAIEDSVVNPTNSIFRGIDLGYDGISFATLTSVGATQVVQLRKLDDLSVIKEFSVPGAVFNKISFSPNKQHLATASDDGFCTIWDIAAGSPVMYLNNIGEYGNVMVTPDNYYLASKSALNEVAFNIAGQYYTFDQFDIYLNRPDIVLDRLHYASPDLLRFYRQAYYKRLNKLKGSNADTTIVYNVPGLTLTNRTAMLTTTANNKQELLFAVTDSLAQGGKLEVRINNNKVYAQPITATDKTIPVMAELAYGNNLIEAVYINNRNIESRKQKITINYKPLKAAPVKVWYIGIGISKYQDSAMNLRYAAKDIRDIASAIRKKYPTAVIDTLLNASATAANIMALKTKLLNTSVNDKVIISFSGHGLVDDSLNWYFATYNIDFKSPAGKGLSYDAMQSLLDGIPARQKLLLLDACHSGELDKESDITFANKETGMQTGVKETGAKGITIRFKNSSKVGLQNSFELMQELFANLQYGNGGSVISAAGGKEYAFESEVWKNGVFTYSLLKALRSKATDADENGSISIRELKNVVFETVKQLTGGRQKPTSRVEAYEDWVIW